MNKKFINKEDKTVSKEIKYMSSFLLKKFNEVEKIHWWWEGRRSLVRNLTKGLAVKRVLDVGCGSGETMIFLKKIFPEAQVYGIDKSSEAIKYSKTRVNKNVYVRDASNLKFKTEYFDAVFFLDILEHIPNDAKVVKEAKRVLKKGGKIIITSPGLKFIWSDHDTMQGHVRRYTRREIRRLATDAKMKIVFISYFNFLLSPPIIIIRLMSKLRPLRKLASYDRGFNYDIAFKPWANKILRTIFVSEVKLINIIRYPIGVSIAAVFQKR